jgi:hypothetical protein
VVSATDPHGLKQGRCSQLLLPVADLKRSGKKKAKKNLTVFVKTSKGTEEEATFRVL